MHTACELRLLQSSTWLSVYDSRSVLLHLDYVALCLRCIDVDVKRELALRRAEERLIEVL